MQLRDYQIEALESVRRLWEAGKPRLLGHAATGLGKTVIAAHVPQYFPELVRYGILVLVPRQEIAAQFARTFQRLYPHLSVGIEMGQSRALGAEDVIIMSPATTGRDVSDRIYRFDRHFGIIINDEAHHTVEGGINDNVLSWFGVGSHMCERLPDGHYPLVLHLTATPNRADGKGLSPWADEVAFSYDLAWGIQNGWLVDVRAYQVIEESRASDMDGYEADLCARIYRDYCSGLRALVFAANRESARLMCERLRQIGVRAAYIDGETDRRERQYILEQHRTGQIDVICNVGVLTEGYDDPGLQAGLLFRATQSPVLYQQIIGRFLRPAVPVDQYATAEERKRAIEASSKPFAVIVDVYTTTLRNSLVTVPSLFGLRNDFDPKGRRMVKDVVEIIKLVEEEEPERPLRDITSIEELQVALRRIDVWRGTIHNERLVAFSPLRWVREVGMVGLYMPRAPRGSHVYDSLPHIRLFLKLSDGWAELEINVGGWSRHLKRAVRPSATVLERGQTAKWVVSRMRELEQRIKTNYPDVWKQLQRRIVDAERPADEKTLQRLRALNVRWREDRPLTREHAAILLDYARIREKVQAIVNGEQGDKSTQKLLREVVYDSAWYRSWAAEHELGACAEAA